MSESIVEKEASSGCSGVPRGEKRRREIAAVAARVFFENGFSDTTMQMIALRAGASKETLYRHFGSKEGLFAEIVETRANCFLGNLDENFEKPGSVADVLRDLARILLETMVSDDGIMLCRTVVSEAGRNPELGEIFYDRGPMRVRRRLTEFLAAARSRGEITCADPQLAARIFLGAIVSNYHLSRLVLATPETVTHRDIVIHVDEVVDMFLLKYGAR